jgi:hypothetical protein
MERAGHRFVELAHRIQAVLKEKAIEYTASLPVGAFGYDPAWRGYIWDRTGKFPR